MGAATRPSSLAGTLPHPTTIPVALTPTARRDSPVLSCRDPPASEDDPRRPDPDQANGAPGFRPGPRVSGSWRGFGYSFHWEKA
jgi:hypothetical protein